MAIHQLLEAVAVAFHAEGIRETQRHLAAMGAGHLSGGDEGPLGGLAVPEIALKVEKFCLGHQIQIQIGRIQPHRGPQVGAHGALGVWGHQDQTAGRAGPTAGGGGIKAGTHRANVMGKDGP